MFVKENPDRKKKKKPKKKKKKKKKIGQDFKYLMNERPFRMR